MRSDGNNMRLKCVFIRGLFGKFDHKIVLNTQDKITIIYGPNGYGKTTILKLLNSFFKGEFAEFNDIPFYSFQLEFDNGNVVNVYKNFFFLARQSLINNSYDQVLLKKPFFDKNALKDLATKEQDNLSYEIDLTNDNRIFIENKSEALNKWEIFAYYFNNFIEIPITNRNPNLHKISIIKEIIKQKNEDKEFLNSLLKRSSYNCNYKLDSLKSVYEKLVSQNIITDVNEDFDKNIIRPNLMENIYYEYSIGAPKTTLKSPTFLTEIRDNVSTQLIESQRLIYYNEDTDNNLRKNWDQRTESVSQLCKVSEKKYVYAVNKCSDEIKDQMSKCYEDYSSVSQKLDKTFPNRLLDATMIRNRDEIEVLSLMSEFKDLEKLQNQLYKLGLYSSDEVNPIRQLNKSSLQRETLLALKLYIDDNKEKSFVFFDLQKKMQNFSNIIQKLFVNKSVKFSLNKGLIFTDLDTNVELSPEHLSSGEQHIIVLFFDLLFRAKECSLILIDEPEISLHVIWQRKFIEILSDIMNIVNMDVVISTHSPSIVHDRMDLTVSLEGVKNGVQRFS